MDWTRTFFDDDYIKLYESRLTQERTDREVAFLINHVFKDTTKNILDIPCGYGRHSIALVKEGYSVWGVDNSPEMLEKALSDAKDLPNNLKENLLLQSADMRTYRGPIQFDAVLNLFSSFGYFNDEASNEAVAETLCANLKPGGVLVIDIRNLERDLVEFSKSDWTQKHDLGNSTVIEKLDPESNKHTMVYLYTLDGETKERSAVWQQYYLHDIESMLRSYGCSVEKTFGNYKGDPYTKESPRLIVVARKER